MPTDLYHFQVVLRQQEVIRVERRAADEQAARIAGALSELGPAIARLAGRPGRRAAPIQAARRIS